MPTRMKEYARVFLLVLVAVVAFGYVRMQGAKGYALEVGTTAPLFHLPLRTGGAMGLPEYRGRVVVVNFWASWCAPCVAEMPSLERLHRALSRDGLVVLGIAVDEDETALARFVEKAGLSFPILRDPGGVVASGSYKTTGYPETFVVDRAGMIRETYVGSAEWDTPEALDHFRGLLKPADR
jgi:peroxiredoxin